MEHFERAHLLVGGFTFSSEGSLRNITELNSTTRPDREREEPGEREQQLGQILTLVQEERQTEKQQRELIK